MAFDGSTLNVPDEAMNRQAFGAPVASRGRAAFPQVRLTALVEVGTRAAFAWRAGAYDGTEEAQVEALLPWLSTGMLVLADRGYGGFPLWRRVADTGADLLTKDRGYRGREPLVDAGIDSEQRAADVAGCVRVGASRARALDRGGVHGDAAVARPEGGGIA